MRSRLFAVAALVIVGTGLFLGGVGSASTPVSAEAHHLALISFSEATSQARAACEADGATVSTAMAAFTAQNPGTTITAALLVGKRHGGPYITNWPYNPAYYVFSIKSGVLDLAVLKSVGPPFVYTKPKAFEGPQNCSGVQALRGTKRVLQAVAACEADGATVSTAIAAFNAQYPQLQATAKGLVSSAHGGPYIQSWPDNPSYYRYSVKAGVLQISIVKVHGPPATFSDAKTYAGPQDCSFG
jgi:hypothetical protein